MVNPLVKEMVEELAGPCAQWQIGMDVRHPSGRTVRLTGGQYWGRHGVSNFWYWREVLPDGSLGPEEHGYGWN